MTKIICTLGPASDKKILVRRMIAAGMDVARLNFSHGDHASCRRSIFVVRQLAHECARPIPILGDLEGYRVRVGKLERGLPVQLERGQRVWLTSKADTPAARIIPFDFRGPLEKIRQGQFIYIDDGTIALRVEGRDKQRALLRARVVIPGILKERKGINMPGVSMDFEELTEKDKQDIRFSIEHSIEYIAQSFVRNSTDILNLKEYLAERGCRAKVIAKIESREGIKNIDGIIAVSDGIMIARGDMGIAIPVYEVPAVQKAIIKKCNAAKKPVITATQMLESMTQSRIPTRAEVSDVANAVLDGSDYVMLSAETAAGRYPVESVRIMEKITRFYRKLKTKKKSI